SLLFVSGWVSENVLYSVFWRYDLRTGTISRAFEDIEQAPYETPFFSPDGKLLVFHSAICTTTETDRICRDALQVRDAVTGNLIRGMPADGLDKWQDMSIFAFSPDSSLITSGGEDGAVRVWDVASGMLKYKFQHESNVTSLSFSPDGSVLVSVGEDATVRFWDMKSGESLYTLHGMLDMWFQNAAYIDGGKKLLVNYYDGKFKEYSLDEHFLPVAPLDITMETEKRFRTQMGQYTPDLVMRFSPDGQTMALLVNASVQIWDLRTGKKTLTLPEFNREIFSMEFSPAGNLLAMADHNVRLWQVSPKKMIGTLEINGDQITDIAFNSDGTRAAFASTMEDAQVWDMSTHRRILTLKPECRTVYLAYSPDGKKLALAGECGIELFDAVSGARLDKFPNDQGTPIGISFSADGSLLFFVSGNGRRAWNLTSGKQIYAIKRLDDYMGRAALSPSLLAVTDWYETPIYFFDPVSGKRLYEFPYGKGSNAIALSPNGRLIALDNYSRISLLDAASGMELLSVDFRLPYTMSFSPDSTLLAARSYGEVAHLWDISGAVEYSDQVPLQTPTPNLALTPTARPTATPAPTLSLSIPTTSTPLPEGMQAKRVAQMEKLSEFGRGRMNTVAWSMDGKTLAVGGYPGAYIFKAGKTQPTGFFPTDSVLLLLSFSSDGRYLAGQISNYEIVVWDVETGKTLHKFENLYCWNRGMTFSSENEFLVADCGDTVYTWKIADGSLVSKKNKEIGSELTSGKFTVQTGMKSARLIDTQTGEIVKTFEIPGMAPALSIFSPDGKTLAVWHYQYEIARTGVYFPGQDLKTILQLWTIRPDQPPALRAELATGTWHQGLMEPEILQALSFTPDSRMLATASGDDTTQIWEVKSGRLLTTLPGGRSIDFSPDGRQLASLDSNGAHIWNVSSTQPKITWEISSFDRYSYSLVLTNHGTELVSITDGAYRFFALSDSTLAGPSRQIELPGVSGQSMSVSPDGSRLAYGTANGIFVGENDPQDPNWRTLSQFAEPLHYDRSMNLVFSPDGALLVSDDPDNTVRLWDLESFTFMELASSTFLRELLYSPLSEFLFSPDGTMLLGKNWPASEPSTLCLWDTRTGKLLRHWKARIDQVAFHPHQPILIGTEYATGLVRFFDLRTGDLIKEIFADEGIRQIIFSPDGSLLVLGYDSKFEIRDAETLELLKEVQTGSRLLTFSPDGKMLIVGLNDGRIQVWGWRSDNE
ncbi:MAG TPA: hypothetical protein VHP14_04005, partial [Anaerolineales bacterium]|nr:hypothetical protein [Anaerolineales bacterium]